MCRVLSIDDNPMNLQLVHDVLGLAKIEVDDATSGHGGIALAMQHSYDGIVLDFDLRDMSGLEVIHALRSQGMQAPIVVASARHDVTSRERCFQAGAADFIEKPYAIQDFQDRIERAFHRAVG